MRALVPVLLCVAFLLGCSSHDLPAIANPTQLVADCDALAKAAGDPSIPRDKWPASIAALHPMAVSRDPSGIHITTFSETGVGSRGYVVADAKPADTRNLTFSDIGYVHIYRFDFRP